MKIRLRVTFSLTNLLHSLTHEVIMENDFTDTELKEKLQEECKGMVDIDHNQIMVKDILLVVDLGSDESRTTSKH